MAARHLYLARHGEPNDQGSLTEVGRRQAARLGQRLSTVELTSIHHGPLPRAAQTAGVIATHVRSNALPIEIEAAGDYVPHVPDREDIEAAYAPRVVASLADVSTAEASHGAALAQQAIEVFTGPALGNVERHDLVVTHAFTVGWLVRHACGGPRWRWWGLNFGHAALTVIRYFDDRPPTLVVVNDMTHLPAELRWTGFPDGWGL